MRYKLLAIPPDRTVQIITDNVKGMAAKAGDDPGETTLHGRLGDGYYASVYPHKFKEVEIITEYERIEAGTLGSLLVHKPKNESIWHPFRAIDVSSRVDENVIVCELDEEEAKQLPELSP